MNCEEALLLISGHLDKENTRDEENALMEHLHTCEACRAVLTAYEEADRDLAAMQEKAPSDLCANVMSVIKKDWAKKNRKPWISLSIAAALVLVIGVGTLSKTYDVPAEKAPTVEAVVCETASEPQTVSARGLSEECVPAADGAAVAQRISDERKADVVLVRELYCEIEEFPCETLEEGYLLYDLPDRDTAVYLSETYGCFIFEQEQEADYYALLAP